MAEIQKLNYPVSQQIEIPPPSYDEAQTQQALCLQNPPTLSSEHSLIYATHNTDLTSFKPIVIPQVSKSFRGAFFSPFSRAYSPTLADHSILPSEFLPFIDGLNEAFIAAPAFQIASYLGGIMAFTPIHPVMWAGMGLQLAAGATSVATSWTRAKAFVKHANETVFQPRGLKVKVLKTKKMMTALGHEGEVLNLPPLEYDEASSPEEGHFLEGEERNDPRMRRIRALGDDIAPLTFRGLPEPESMENWWKRMGQKGALKKDAKMQKKLMKERAEGEKKLSEKTQEAEKEGRKADKEIAKIQKEQLKEHEKAERKFEKRKAQDPEERAKIQKDYEKEMRKLDKEMEKARREKEKKVGEKMGDGQKEMDKADKNEHKIAQKIYWIVIDKEEVLDQEVGNEDVESLESR